MKNDDKTLNIRKVLSTDNQAIDEVYKTLRLCGENMYIHQGLGHWKTPYPIEAIEQNCADKSVYIVSKCGITIATFQIEKAGNGVNLSKVAVSPDYEGKGIGRICLQYVYQFCAEEGLSRICLEVYDQSRQAISFYLKNGFKIVGSAPTKRFNVYIMEKNLP